MECRKRFPDGFLVHFAAGNGYAQFISLADIMNVRIAQKTCCARVDVVCFKLFAQLCFHIGKAAVQTAKINRRGQLKRCLNDVVFQIRG